MSAPSNGAHPKLPTAEGVLAERSGVIAANCQLGLA